MILGVRQGSESSDLLYVENHFSFDSRFRYVESG